ncbi:hypothetical protein [Actinokineospora sp. NBRC 105648]|uniref:hypothetical protein n=1 Tax=Actinokineospora sp. NBRC 105648 TaxID=3032206 RepID=UPI002555B0AC|nr:hypothetical protein [Actinokineospora sp. NBRC 105648]
MDDDGFLLEPGAESDGWCRPADAAAQGGWVLLGEPGAGKTTTFASLVPEVEQDCSPEPGEPGTVWLTGVELEDRAAADELLGVHFSALPLTSSSVGGGVEPAALRVVIDQLDESLFLRHLPSWLRRQLRGRDTRNLRIWLACRTAVYPVELTEVLDARLGACRVGDLAPLTRCDADELVTGAGVDAEAFLEAVVANGAGALASVPLTLKVLLNAYVQDRTSLSGGPLQLFKLGVDVLAEEPSRDRLRGWEASTGQQRVAIAARVAAHLVLSGRRSVHTRVLGAASDQAVQMGQVVGEHETAGGGRFEVTKPLVQESLATALFSRTGPDSAAFAHSSFAAYLSARYLSAQLVGPSPMPQQQLKGLFLVSAPDEDTAAVPEHLRETAAWMLAHVPEQVEWLAGSDPEGLVAHTAVITCHRTRAVVVEGLLARADRIELTNRAWQRARWHVAHPGLVDQLTAAFDEALDRVDDDWSAVATARLAVRLAHDSGLAVLAGPLLRVVENDRWPVAVRQSAAKAALSVGSKADTVERLRSVLATLVPPSDADPDTSAWDGQETNSPAELVGTLLSLLWPGHLTFAEVAPYFRPVFSRHFTGMFSAQVPLIPQGVDDDDLPALIVRTETMLHAHGVRLQQPDADAMYEDIEDASAVSVPQAAPSPLSYERANRLRTLVLPVADRVLSSPRARELLHPVARMLLWFLTGFARLPMPWPVDVINALDGSEHDHTRDVRRDLAEALLEIAYQLDPAQYDYWTHRIVGAWGTPGYGTDRATPPGVRRGNRTHLLDAGDAHWTRTRAACHRGTGNTPLADVLDDLASRLAQPPETTPEPDLEVWELADKFATAQRTRLDKAVAGDATGFWTLVKYLRLDPKTGRHELTESWMANRYAGAMLWPADELDQRLRVAARLYLQSEHDHHLAWFGLPTGDWRAEAGMVALAVLQDELDDLPTERWQHWAGAILGHVGHFGTTHLSLDQKLLAYATRHAQAELAAVLVQYVRKQVLGQDGPLRLPELPSTFTSQLTELAVELASAIQAQPRESSAPGANRSQEGEHIPGIEGPIVLSSDDVLRANAIRSWGVLLQQPLDAGDVTAIRLAMDVLDRYETSPDSDVARQMATAAARALLTADPAANWPAVHSRLTTSPRLAQPLALDCAAAEKTNHITAELPDMALGQVYRWLIGACPPELDIDSSDFRIVTAENGVHAWCRNILVVLADRGTPDTVHVLRSLVNDHPELLAIQAAVHQARRRAQAFAVTRLDPEQVTTLLRDRTRRVVNTATQLASVILETFDLIARDLHTHGNLLWDCERQPRLSDTAPNSALPLAWRPKPEGALGAYLAHELTLRLAGDRVVVNREVVIHPTGHGDSGERPDIKIDVICQGDAIVESPVLSVPIEIKGAWHKDLLTAQDTQLAQQYLSRMNTSDGIYVVGWYPFEHWDMLTPTDRRRAVANRHGSALKLKGILELQASQIHAVTGRRTHPYVFNIPRATPSTK